MLEVHVIFKPFLIVQEKKFIYTFLVGNKHTGIFCDTVPCLNFQSSRVKYVLQFIYLCYLFHFDAKLGKGPKKKENFPLGELFPPHPAH